MPLDVATLIEHTCFLAIGLGSALLLYRVIGRAWLLGLFESEGQPSSRLVAAMGIVVFTLIMEGLGRISDTLADTNFLMAGALWGFGTSKLIASRFAARASSPDTEIKTENAAVNSERTTINATDAPPQEASSPKKAAPRRA